MAYGHKRIRPFSRMPPYIMIVVLLSGLCSFCCECCLQFFSMSVMRGETDFDVCLLLHDKDSTEHNALDKRAHGESLHLGSPERGMLHSVCQDKGRCIEEQTEVVCTVGVARHTVCLEILQVLYPLMRSFT